MLSKTYKYELEVAPVKITWRQELVEDSDLGNFYVRLTPTVNHAMEYIHEGEGWRPGHISRTKINVDKIGGTRANILGGMARNKSAMQGRKIFNELMGDMQADIQKKLDMQARIKRNKMTGQRWNKKG